MEMSAQIGLTVLRVKVGDEQTAGIRTINCGLAYEKQNQTTLFSTTLKSKYNVAWSISLPHKC